MSECNTISCVWFFFLCQQWAGTRPLETHDESKRSSTLRKASRFGCCFTMLHWASQTHEKNGVDDRSSDGQPGLLTVPSWQRHSNCGGITWKVDVVGSTESFLGLTLDVGSCWVTKFDRTITRSCSSSSNLQVSHCKRLTTYPDCWEQIVTTLGMFQSPAVTASKHLTLRTLYISLTVQTPLESTSIWIAVRGLQFDSNWWSLDSLSH